MQEFEGRVAVVTGAASGMGRAFAERFAQEGMKVVLADIEQDALDLAVSELRQQEYDVLGVTTDVSSDEQIRALAEQTIETYGKVHVLCNNAGVGGGGAGPIWEATENDWQWTFGVNFWGVVSGIRAFVPLILEHGEGGHIINTASVAGLTRGDGIPLYSASKHAVVSISEALYTHLRDVDESVGASVLCPGLVNTRITESSRNRPPELGGTDFFDLAAPKSPFALRLEQEGHDPSYVAEIVLQGIRDQQFWLLTDEDFDDRIRARTDDIIGRRNWERQLLI